MHPACISHRLGAYATLKPSRGFQRLNADCAVQPLNVIGRPHHLQRPLSIRETIRDAEARSLFSVIRLGSKRFQTAHMAIPQVDINSLLGFEAFVIPIAREHAFASE